MKVLLRRNVSKLGAIGEVVEVKPGYARNYLLPHGLAVQPTKGNLKAIEEEKAQYLAELAQEREEVEARAAAVQGKEITISARANAEGHLYGSVGPAQVAAALAEEGIFLESDVVKLDEPIRQLDKYDVTLQFGHDVAATIHVWIVPVHDADDEDASEPSGAPQSDEEDSPPDEEA